eukprot:3577900-Prymnesium_polylepis.1
MVWCGRRQIRCDEACAVSCGGWAVVVAQRVEAERARGSSDVVVVPLLREVALRPREFELGGSERP